ncbi:putative glycosyltransferase At5g03795 isoform X1 [Nicotiana tabacum]|uniref:Glycosyltransferase At5g03795 isoform X1 n=1 Tax=Nicotiana tabacum TaxID=4097 RepID=A0A1S4B515_TOBAC|nr:PREDICTED: probable glycosyltransferase At5g03795 [Nicotiana tabacum]
MASTPLSIMLKILTHRRDSNSPQSFFFFIPTALALVTSLLILFYISFISKFFTHSHQTHLTFTRSSDFSSFNSTSHKPVNISFLGSMQSFGTGGIGNVQSQRHMELNGKYVNDNAVFHDRDTFMNDYKEMNKSLKIYVYPHQKADPFSNVLLAVDFEPGGNYASESYFKKVLVTSHFTTKDPSSADLFFLPFSIARLRHDPRVGIDGIKDFIKSYIFNISHKYPYWNYSNGADHFYVACHSIGRFAMEKAIDVKINAIQVVCSSSYFVSAYIPHKDASLPQIWPRLGSEPNLAPYKRKKLGFFAGTINSPVREKLLEWWGNDSDIFVHFGRLERSYTEELLDSKFCLHVKGYEVNTARVADALFYGCVPVIIANHYDLPFADILDWKHFSVIVATLDIPLLKKILQGITQQEYLMLHSNVLKGRKHFQWHMSPVDFDAFYMVMYELWLRSSLRLQ